MFKYKKFIIAGTLLLIVISIGTFGYWFITDKQYPLIDCVYMTVITISTIGYGEIINLSGNTTGRIFTIFIAFLGIGTSAYLLSNFTAFIVEGDIKETFRRRKMEKRVSAFKNHYIVCGVEGVGFYIIKELFETKRQQVILDMDKEKIEKLLETFPELAFVVGDATDDNTLLKTGIKNARGLFAVTGDDNHNLVISLTAKQLNPDVRVVSRCSQLDHVEKLKKAGADAVVSPTFIGGLRMASEMIRPAVVSFLDVMLRDKEKSLRIEEVVVPPSFAGKPIAALNLKKTHALLLLAVKTGEEWIYNPPEDYILSAHSILIFLGATEERQRFENMLS
jgi:voltage-gated potassium channel